jgi:hypothetical protein
MFSQQSQYVIFPDSNIVRNRIGQLKLSDRHAIAVCSYHPIDHVTFDPKWHNVAYRRTGHDHPFFETGYSLDLSKAHIDVSKAGDYRILISLVDKNVSNSFTKCRKENYHNFAGNIIVVSEAETKKFYYFNNDAGMMPIEGNVMQLNNVELPVASPKSSKASKQQTNELFTYETFLNDVCLGNTELANNLFKIKVFVRNTDAVTKNIKDMHPCCIWIMVDKAGNVANVYSNWVEMPIKKNVHIDNLKLEIKSHSYLFSEQKVKEVIIQNLQKESLDLEKGLIMVYTAGEKLQIQYIDYNDQPQTSVLPGKKSDYYDAGKPNVTKITEAVRRKDKTLAVGNETFLSLKAKNLFNKDTAHAYDAGLNQVVIGGEKRLNSFDKTRPLVSGKALKATRLLEDKIIIHKTQAISEIVYQLEKHFSKKAGDAILLNMNQLEAHYVALIIMANFDAASCCEGVEIVAEPLILQEDFDYSILGKYYVYPSSADTYAVQFVCLQSGVPVIKDVCVKQNMAEEFLAGIQEVISNNAPISAEWLKTCLDKSYDIPYVGHYIQMLTHLLIAFVNYESYRKNIGLYFDERGSFGFLTPTVAEIGSGVRLSMGLVPNAEWKECVAAGIKKFNEAFKTLLSSSFFKLNLNDICTLFYESHLKAYGHKIFLQQLIADQGNPAGLMKLIDSLKEEVNVKQLVNQYDRDCAFKDLANSLDSNASIPFSKCDKDFKELYIAINEIYDELSRLMNIKTDDIKLDANDSLYRHMLVLRNKIDDFRWQSYLAVQKDEDGLDVSSESDNEIGQGNNDKHYTICGMSALFLPLIAYMDTQIQKNADQQTVPVYLNLLPYVYFELNVYKTYFRQSYIQIQENQEEALVMFYDDTPCITNEADKPVNIISSQQILDYLSDIDKTKLFIADVTSSTSQRKEEIIAFWRQCGGNHILCFAESALKNRQLALDMAHYGVAKVFCNDPKNDIYLLMKELLRNYSKRTSSFYSTKIRRNMRQATLHQSQEQIIKDREAKIKEAVQEINMEVNSVMAKINDAAQKVGQQIDERVRKSMEEINAVVSLVHHSIFGKKEEVIEENKQNEKTKKQLLLS